MCEKDTIERIGPFVRIILCSDCLREKERSITQKLARHATYQKERVPDPGLHPNIDPGAIHTSAALPYTIHEWGTMQAKVASSLNLSLKAKDIVPKKTNDTPCERCGELVRSTIRKPRVNLCGTHYLEYQRERKTRNKKDQREREKR